MRLSRTGKIRFAVLDTCANLCAGLNAWFTFAKPSTNKQQTINNKERNTGKPSWLPRNCICFVGL